MCKKRRSVKNSSRSISPDASTSQICCGAHESAQFSQLRPSRRTTHTWKSDLSLSRFDPVTRHTRPTVNSLRSISPLPSMSNTSNSRTESISDLAMAAIDERPDSRKKCNAVANVSRLSRPFSSATSCDCAAAHEDELSSRHGCALARGF